MLHCGLMVRDAASLLLTMRVESCGAAGKDLILRSALCARLEGWAAKEKEPKNRIHPARTCPSYGEEASSKMKRAQGMPGALLHPQPCVRSEEAHKHSHYR